METTAAELSHISLEDPPPASEKTTRDRRPGSKVELGGLHTGESGECSQTLAFKKARLNIKRRKGRLLCGEVNEDVSHLSLSSELLASSDYRMEEFGVL